MFCVSIICKSIYDLCRLPMESCILNQPNKGSVEGGGRKHSTDTLKTIQPLFMIGKGKMHLGLKPANANLQLSSSMVKIK